MNALIIEDERLVGEELQSLLGEVAPEIRVLDILPSLKVTRKWFLYNAEPDLLFMDIQLSDGISFALLDQFSLSCPIVFTTAYDEYAIRAFKVNGVDYILKPVERDELARAVAKCKTILDARTPYPTDLDSFLQMYAAPQTTPRYKEKFIVHLRNQWLPIPTRDIACFVKDSVIYLYTFGGDRHVLDTESLEDIEELVDPDQFYRANRQTIVQMNAIASIRPRENQKLILSLRPPLKLEVDVSREKAPSFKKWFDR